MRRFEWSHTPSATRPTYDVPVYEDDFFVAVPSLGALTEGWLLVLPRRSLPNLSHLKQVERVALKQVVAALSKRLRIYERPIFRFEHGAETGSAIGCGVDQAHLHIVPLDFDLYAAATQDCSMQWHELPPQSDPSLHSQVRQYLTVQADDGRAAIGFPSADTSQWFRRLIARQLGASERWDYKKFPNYEAVKIAAAAITVADA